LHDLIHLSDLKELISSQKHSIEDWSPEAGEGRGGTIEASLYGNTHKVTEK
jgi:hypothetical protein